MPEQNYDHALQSLMQRADVSSFKALVRAAGVSERQIRRLRCGEVEQMRVDVLLKLSLVLQVPLAELIETFTKVGFSGQSATASQESELAIADLNREYHRLVAQLEQQRQALWQEFQQSSLQILESLLLQWPTAAAAAQNNPQLPAARLLPLLQPLSQLLQQWGVEAITPVGVELPYDPKVHQLMDGTAQEGDLVKVRYTGYRQGDKLLYRAKVSPL
ncbi:MAG: helix-turn-helix domain-containing protein [Chroococcidiopsidaceae cyanobacterium CP_BM_RX_35]|nr:helix-turn-helix domain-containing protein [Chroococcidiopsidaceae cyanobacterium CP_BM_RX_35]